MKRIINFLLSLTLVMGLFTIPTVEVHAEDETSLELVSVSVDKTNAVAGDVVTLTVKVNEGLPNFEWADVGYTTPADNYKWISLDQIDETTFQCVLETDEYFYNGLWQLDCVELSYSESFFIFEADEYDLSVGNFTITGGSNDFILPELLSISLDKTEIVAGETVTVTAKATDNVGIDYLDCCFKEPMTEEYHGFSFEYVSDNTYVAKIETTPWIVNGDWELVYVDIYDKSHNNALYDVDENNLSPLKFTVSGGTPDYEEPVLVSLTVDKTEVLIGETVIVSAVATDDVSGIDTIWVGYTNGEYSNDIYLEEASSGVFVGEFKTDSSFSEGEWYIYDIWIEDRSGKGYYVDLEEHDYSSCNLKLKNPVITEISFEIKEYTMYINEFIEFVEPVVKAGDLILDYELSYSVEGDSVDFDEYWGYYAEKLGTTVITASAENGVSATVTVNVLPRPARLKSFEIINFVDEFNNGKSFKVNYNVDLKEGEEITNIYLYYANTQKDRYAEFVVVEDAITFDVGEYVSNNLFEFFMLVIELRGEDGYDSQYYSPYSKEELLEFGTDLDEAGVYELYELNKDYSFKVKSVASDTKAPSIDNLNLSQNKNLVTVTFTSDENQSDIEEVEFLFEDKDGNIKEVYAYDGTSENDSYIFDVYLDNDFYLNAPYGTYDLVGVRVSDEAGNINEYIVTEELSIVSRKEDNCLENLKVEDLQVLTNYVDNKVHIRVEDGDYFGSREVTVAPKNEEKFKYLPYLCTWINFDEELTGNEEEFLATFEVEYQKNYQDVETITLQVPVVVSNKTVGEIVPVDIREICMTDDEYNDYDGSDEVMQIEVKLDNGQTKLISVKKTSEDYYDEFKLENGKNVALCRYDYYYDPIYRYDYKEEDSDLAYDACMYGEAFVYVVDEDGILTDRHDAELTKAERPTRQIKDNQNVVNVSFLLGEMPSYAKVETTKLNDVASFASNYHVAYDFTTKVNNEEVQPLYNAKLTVSLPKELQNQEVTVYSLNGTETKKVVTKNVTTTIEFDTNNIDKFVFVGKSKNASHTHNHTSKVTAPTCTEKGYTTWKCDCGDTYTTDEKPKLNHSFTKYVSNNDATTEKDGTKTAKCDRCSATDTITDVGSKLPTQEPSKPVVEGTSRTFGASRYETAFKTANTLKATLGVDKFETAIVANGTNFADALAGSYLAAKKSAPILMTDKNGKNITNLVNYIKTNVQPGGTVYILGGYAALPNSIDKGLAGYTVKRLAGNDRYETNLLILEEAEVTSEAILVATGTGFADSLSASATGLPMLLVNKELNPKQKAFLEAHKGNAKYIVGGTSAVSAKVEQQVKAYGTVKRLAGNGRYDTSVLVAKEFFSNPTSAVVAYGRNFPDGLSGGPLAYTIGGPLLLAENKQVNTIANYTKSLGITSGYVLGGSGLVSDSSVKTIFDAKTIK